MKDIRKENVNIDEILTDIKSYFSTRTYKSIKKKKETIKDIRKENFNNGKILRYITKLFEPEENYYKPIRIGNAFSGNYTEYESSGDKDKTLSNKEYLNEIKSDLNNMMNDLKTKGKWKFN